MQININGINYTLPSSLMAVTLQQRIDFDTKYGKKLREQLTKIAEIDDPVMKENEFTAYHMELACKTLAFFSGAPLTVVENTDIRQVLLVYHETMKGYTEDVDFMNHEHQLQLEFDWNGDVWKIEPPVLNENSTMTFGEFVTSKMVVQEMVEYGQDKWGALLKLACIYFRKQGEKYSDDLINEEKERFNLLKTLPLPYALHVGFFLKTSIDSWINTFLFSGKAEAKEPELV